MCRSFALFDIHKYFVFRKKRTTVGDGGKEAISACQTQSTRLAYAVRRQHTHISTRIIGRTTHYGHDAASDTFIDDHDDP